MGRTNTIAFILGEVVIVVISLILALSGIPVTLPLVETFLNKHGGTPSNPYDFLGPGIFTVVISFFFLCSVLSCLWFCTVGRRIDGT